MSMYIVFSLYLGLSATEVFISSIGPFGPFLEFPPPCLHCPGVLHAVYFFHESSLHSNLGCFQIPV